MEGKRTSLPNPNKQRFYDNLERGRITRNKNQTDLLCVWKLRTSRDAANLTLERRPQVLKLTSLLSRSYIEEASLCLST